MERLTFAVSNSKVEGRTLSGIAHVYGTVTSKYGGHSFAAGAFTKSIAAGRVASFAYHDPGKLLATQKAGSLRLTDGPQGLGFEIDLPEGVSYAEDLRALVASGVDIGMSFQVPTTGQSVRKNGVKTWTDTTLISVDPVLDAGPVSPAFEGTSVMLHSQDGESALSATTKIKARLRARKGSA